jgi:hypothetical protein
MSKKLLALGFLGVPGERYLSPLKGWSGVSHVFFIRRTHNTTLDVKMMGLSLTYLDIHCALSGKIIHTTYNIVLFHTATCCDKHISAWLIFLERLSYTTFHWVICFMTDGFVWILLYFSDFKSIFWTAPMYWLSLSFEDGHNYDNVVKHRILKCWCNIFASLKT